MKLRYYATLQGVTHTKEETWAQPTKTLGDLIDALCRKYGREFSKWVSCDENGFGKLSIFLVNGQDYRSLDGLETRLSPDDTISIFPPIAGG
jgi:molybdopterin synthase sulfur carrier subunit